MGTYRSYAKLIMGDQKRQKVISKLDPQELAGPRGEGEVHCRQRRADAEIQRWNQPCPICGTKRGSL